MIANITGCSQTALAVAFQRLHRGLAVRTVSTVRQPKRVLSIQSHVVYGAAGNSAAVFPMRRLGIDVWPLNTVQFSNHTQYGKWTGHVFPPEHLGEIADGLEVAGALPKCDGVLSGYLGSEAQGSQVLDIVQRVKKAHPDAIYCCDPVMGHPEKGCIVAPGVAEFFVQSAAKAADIICPNTLELGILAGGNSALNSMSEVRAAAKQLLDKGPRIVFVKHLGKAGLQDGQSFEMLLTARTHDNAIEEWHVAAPLLPFDRPPVGVGDLTTGLLLAKLLQGASPQAALEHVAGAYAGVMHATKELGEYELQTVAAQDAIANPDVRLVAELLK